MVSRSIQSITFILLTFFLASCQTITENMNTPEVSLVNISQGERVGFQQNFNLSLKVTNPNAKALSLVGLTYELQLDGFDLIKGAANDVPQIAGYSDALVDVQATIGFIEGMQFLNSLFSKNQPELDYKLKVNLDTGLPIIGVIPVVNDGAIDLSKFMEKN